MNTNKATIGFLTMSPDGPFTAGSRVTLKLTYACGETPIAPGGGLTIFLPYTGFTSRWEAGLATANAEADGVATTLETENVYPASYHAKKVPTVRVQVWGRPLRQGEKIHVTLGEPGGLAGGYKVLAKVQEFAAKDARFRAYVDPNGGQYPRPFQLKEHFVELTDVPRFDVLPATPAKLNVTLRNSREDGVFPAVLAAKDAFDNSVENYEGETKIFGVDNDDQPDVNVVDFANGDKGTACVDLRFAKSTGPKRIYAVDWRNQITGASNVVDPEFDEKNIYFGDMHVMTAATSPIERGYFYGDVDDAYWHARNVAGLDFTTVTDGRDAPDDTWERHKRVTEKHNVDGEFVTILAYENDMNCGHKNIYFPGSEGSRSKSVDADHLWNYFKDEKIIAIPHHPNIRAEIPSGGWGPHDYSTHHPEFERLIEICQNRGSFETDEKSDGVEFHGYGSSIQDALSLGLKVGFVGGTDNHRAQPGATNMPLSGRDCRQAQWAGVTAVHAKELTRAAIWDALWTRECHATNGPRNLLKTLTNGAVMGSILDATTNPDHAARRTIKIKIQGSAPIKRVDVVRNNVTIHSFAPNQEAVELQHVDSEPLDKIPPPTVRHANKPKMTFRPFVFYYVRVLQEDNGMAWSSPVWFEM